MTSLFNQDFLTEPRLNEKFRKDLFHKIIEIINSPQTIDLSISERVEIIEVILAGIKSLNSIEEKHSIINKDHSTDFLFSYPNLNFNKYQFNESTINQREVNDILSKLNAIKSNIGPIPDSFLHERSDYYFRTDNEGFDINSFLTCFPALTILPPMKLNYCYSYFEVGGYPIVYISKGTDILSSTEHAYEYIKHFLIDFNQSALLQLSILIHELGQFYLCWHSCYMESEIIYSADDIDLLFGRKDIGSSFKKLDPKVLKSIDFRPTYRTNEDIFQVRLVLFNAWRGFSYCYFTYDRLLNFRRIYELIVPYECGILF